MVTHIVHSKSMDQPGKVVNVGRGQLIRENGVLLEHGLLIGGKDILLYPYWK